MRLVSRVFHRSLSLADIEDAILLEGGKIHFVVTESYDNMDWYRAVQWLGFFPPAESSHFAFRRLPMPFPSITVMGFMMKKKVGDLMLIAASSLLVIGCRTGDRVKIGQDLTPCPEVRPQVCTQDYRPVCAQFGDGSRRTYSNGCSACSDGKVMGFLPGQCPSGNRP